MLDDHLHPVAPDDDMNDMDILPLEIPEPPEPATRQHAVAQVRPIAILELVRDIAGRHPFRALQHMDNT